MDEQQRRIKAIRRVAQGESVTQVCRELQRSRGWYYKWAQRYEQAGVDGLLDRRHPPMDSLITPPWLQQLIIQTRDRLVRQAEAGESFQGFGAREVVRELEKLELTPPHWTTVHRILKRAGRAPYPPRPKNYCPRPTVLGLNAVHQIDIWPRLLQGGVRLYFFHLVDVACWYPYGEVTDNKRSDTALSFLIAGWRELGLPIIAQFDNEMSFTGGRWAHRLGRVVRLCLALGVQVWFIPFYTPERNGYVEGFHGLCNQSFWLRQHFDTPTQVQNVYPEFLEDFREHHHLPAIDDRTPTAMRSLLTTTPIQPLSADFSLHLHSRLPIVAGTIHCVRLADDQGQINVLNHHLSLDRKFAHHYILARVDTAKQQMMLLHQQNADAELESIGIQPFSLPEPVLEFDPDFNYPNGNA